jgi:hypothetical protein
VLLFYVSIITKYIFLNCSNLKKKTKLKASFERLRNDCDL